LRFLVLVLVAQLVSAKLSSFSRYSYLTKFTRLNGSGSLTATSLLSGSSDNNLWVVSQRSLGRPIASPMVVLLVLLMLLHELLQLC